MKSFLLVCTAGLVMLELAACSPPAAEPTPVPTATVSAPTAAPTATLFVSGSGEGRRAPTLAPTAVPTEVPSATPPPSATALPANTATEPATAMPPATATPLAAATNTRPPATPTAELAPAVYVTSLTVNPPEPKGKPEQFFFQVGFLNTVGENVNYPRWRVLIMPTGQTRSVGDPQGESRTIANGASVQSTEPWSINVAVGCESYRAEPVWIDENNKPNPLPRPDGTPSVLEFQICVTTP